jgi:pimeloyl-ACP methyl ester carboxylesterase
VRSMTVTLPEAVRSATIDLDGPTHYFDFGGPADGPTVVCVHGLGGAAWNWAALAPLLTGRCRVLALDLAGHGRTPAAGRPTTVSANRRLLDRFIREVVGEPVVLICNSMGGAISLLEAAAAPDLVSGLVLVNPALPRPALAPIDPRVAATFALMSVPGVGEAALKRRRRRRTAEQQVRETLALCCVDARRIPPDVLALGIALTEERYGQPAGAADFLAAARSLVRMLARSGKFRAAMGRVSAPVLLIHGEADRLVSLRVAEAVAGANPHWRFEVGREIGHVPQLEAPDWTAALVLDWLDSLDSPDSRHSVSNSSTR